MICGKKKRSEEQDSILYTKKFLQTKKLLLLGTGESGKTTIINQMKILHINGFSDQERKDRIPHIRQNIHESIYEILNNMKKIHPPIDIHEHQCRVSYEYILELGPNIPTDFTDEYFDHVKTTWSDEAVQKTYERSNEYQLIDSAEHFLNRIDEIRRPDYIPTNQDILFCRITTKSISKIEFKIPVPKKYGGGLAEFWMFDVGGQRGQRKKWIQLFDGILGILFLIAASDFDQTLREDSKTNRLQEAYNLFTDIVHSKFVRDAGLIVFLNKQDVLKRKIEQGRKIEVYFREFSSFVPSSEKECDNDYERAKSFMKQKILDIASKPVIIEHLGFVKGKNLIQELPPREVYVHYTIATDTCNIKKVFNSVHEIILKSITEGTFGNQLY
nr:unnamed protein product [Callosobruchus chinensis]